MVSGALLLNREIEIVPFLKKKTARLIYPLAFYAILTTYIFSIFPNFISGFWYAIMIIGIYLAIPIVNVFIKNVDMEYIEYFFNHIPVFLSFLFDNRYLQNQDYN